MKIELSDEAIEDIVCATLKEHMKYLKKNIKELKKKGKLASHEEHDLGHDVKMLASMEDVYGYFGGNL
jgi:ABC-type Zn uptake system ZnuABC Zn-binding protein ZnuA